MPSLKDFRVRIASVQSTKKITSAMKMVAASKLRRAQEAAEAARPYAERMEKMLGNLAGSFKGQAGGPKMMSGTGKDDVHLVLVMTANRGLCGGFNSNIIRNARLLIRDLKDKGKQVKVLCVGRKGRDSLRRDYRDLIVDSYTEFARKRVAFVEAAEVATRVTEMFNAGQFDVCTMVYARFKSALTQVVSRQQIVPFPLPETSAAAVPYDYEPSDQEILEDLLPRNLAIQIFRSMLETAMDNATRNAGEMISGLTLKYNRTRQAMITKELIEIISGAEAV